MTEAERQTHRSLAVDLFNFTWTLMEKPERTLEDDDTMIHAAHASRYHWGVCGEPVNRARGEWQISRVYALLSRAEPALHHARRCLEICEAHGIGDFDIAFAHEAMARALAASRDREGFARHHVLAVEYGKAIAEQNDRDLFTIDLKSGPWFGMVSSDAAEVE